MITSPTYVGIDVGKHFLDIFTDGLKLRVPNSRAGFEELLSSVRRLRRRLRFVCEGGSDGNALVGYLQARRRHVCIVPPYRVRQFAKATGRLAKTDAIDAELLCDFGRTLKPGVAGKPDRVIGLLRAVLRRRNQLVRMLRIQRIQRHRLAPNDLEATADRVVKVLLAEINGLERRADLIVERSPAMKRRLDALCDVQGVGSLTAKTVIAELPEIGRLNRKEVAAMAGVAPFNRDSGEAVGKRHIRGGRPYLRTALYMAAFHASRINPVLAPFCKRLRERGKPYRVALVAVMRKLLVHLNQIVARLP